MALQNIAARKKKCVNFFPRMFEFESKVLSHLMLLVTFYIP